ncbi:SpoIIE family protein phosphatase [Halorhodospira neutriphila]|uniref:PPM-type phosphatase domain-containing protein n=1 Tax=Halorhodospira neutriphila TaxID=168379 RepID=A0ABS1E3D2_9GAMM|nr:hypothetical protein [Halorhodospira neutriphila]
MRRPRLRSFLIATILAVALGVFLGATLFSSLLYEKILRRQAEQTAEATAQQTFGSMYQVMRRGWTREDLKAFIATLEEAYEGSPLRVAIYRGALVEALYGEIPGEAEADAAVERAFARGKAQRIEGGDQQRHVMPVEARSECLRCHTNAEPGDVLGVIDVSQDISAAQAQASAGYRWLFFAVTPLALLAAGGTAYFVNRRLSRAIEAFSGQIEQVNAVQDLQHVRPSALDLGFAELNRVMGHIDKLICRLRAIAVDKEMLDAHQRVLEEEQKTAERIVDRATTSSALETPGLRYVYRPAAILGGDILLAASRPNGNLLVLLGDFTGHGIGAAVGVPALATLYYDMVAQGAHPAEMLDAINERLYRSLPPEMFLTAALVEIDPGQRRIGVWNAGMPPVWLIREGAVRERFDSGDLPLGVTRDTAPGRRTLTYCEAAPGSYLFACSDGVTEAAGPEGARYGTEGVEASLTGAPAAQALDGLLEGLERFRGGAEPGDDTSLVALELDRLFAAGADDPAYTEPMQWQAELVLDARSLASVSPVPTLMRMLSELGALEADRQTLYTVTAELYNNALEHGILQLDSSLKGDEAGFEAYYRQRAEALAGLSTGEIRLRLAYAAQREDSGVVIEIEDSGEGFDYERVLDSSGPADGEAQRLVAGRGILLVRSLCDELVYFPPGNRVRARYLPRSHSSG